MRPEHEGTLRGPQSVLRERRLGRTNFAWNTLQRDVRYALRNWRHKPVETATLIVTLAIGIGLPATIATLAYSVEWGSRLGVDDPNTLAWLVSTYRRSRGSAQEMSYPEYVAMRERGRDLFEDVTAQMRMRARLEYDGHVHPAYGNLVAGRHFEVLGTRPALGRFFSPVGRDEIGSPQVVLSWQMWKRLGGDPAMVGRPIRLDRKEFIVSAVAEAGFVGLEVFAPSDFWIPIGAARLLDPRSMLLETRVLRDLRVIARVRPGVAASSANAFVQRVQAQLAAEFPQFYHLGSSAAVVPIRGGPYPDDARYVRGIFRTVSVVSGLLLLVVCVNVAGVLAAASLARHHEIAVRMALGASRGSIVQQVLTEGIMLAVAGGALGLAAMFVAPRVFGAVIPIHESILAAGIVVHPTAIALCMALMASVGALAAALPALVAARASIARILQQHGAAAGRSSAALRGIQPLLVIQIAIAFALTASLVPAVRAIRDTEARAFGLRDPETTLFAAVGGLRRDSSGRRARPIRLARSVISSPAHRAYQTLPWRRRLHGAAR